MEQINSVTSNDDIVGDLNEKSSNTVFDGTASDRKLAKMEDVNKNIRRSDFGKDFLFGCSTSAYQIEGAEDVGGRGPSIWDSYANSIFGSIAQQKADHYKGSRFVAKEDVALMKKLGFNSYRLSIAWPRILPKGRLSGGVSEAGIQFYNDLIDELLAAGIEPFVTLFHWDLPQELEEEYGGFLNINIVNDFGEFADVCFSKFGNRVKHWITLNEPWSYTVTGYALGQHPPSHGHVPETGNLMFQVNVQRLCRKFGGEMENLRPCYIDVHKITTLVLPVEDDHVKHKGDPGREPYIVAHHMILAHARAVSIYNQKYKVDQKGEIGMTNVAICYKPFCTGENEEDVKTAFDFVLGWFLEPLVTGEYPKTMQKKVKDRLPVFLEEQKNQVKGSYDFIGINYYTARYVSEIMDITPHEYHYLTDPGVVAFTVGQDGKPIGVALPSGEYPWLYTYPKGIYKVLNTIKSRYFGEKGKHLVIYITENGATNEVINDNLSNCIFDVGRINYHRDHLYYLKKAMNEGVNVKGYFVWSLLDNFEWSSGYDVKFGLYQVEMENFARRLKMSGICWKNFLADKPDAWNPDEETNANGENEDEKMI